MSDEISVEPLHLLVIGDPTVPFESLVECSRQEIVRVDVRVRAVQRLVGDSGIDASLPNLAVDAPASTTAEPDLRPRDGLSRARIVKGALLLQAGDSRVDAVR